MRKIKLYMVSKCSIKADEQEFAQNLCTVVANKKQVSEYIKTRVISDHYEHYISWLECHHQLDSDISRTKYISLLLEDNPNSLDNYTIRIQKYTIEGLAAVFRMFNYCTPIGTSYETTTELDVYMSLLNKIDSKNNKNNVE